VVRHRHY